MSVKKPLKSSLGDEEVGLHPPSLLPTDLGAPYKEFHPQASSHQECWDAGISLVCSTSR